MVEDQTRSPVSAVNFVVKIHFRLCGRSARPPWSDLAFDYPRTCLGRMNIFHKNTLNLRWASKSKLRICLGKHFLENFSSSICLGVGYKMKTFTTRSYYCKEILPLSNQLSRHILLYAVQLVIKKQRKIARIVCCGNIHAKKFLIGVIYCAISSLVSVSLFLSQ